MQANEKPGTEAARSDGGPVVVVAGPTASGKSALGLALAEAFDGVVINADSMQVYRELDVLTARPTPADLARVPHRLYGVMDGTTACSADLWRDLAEAEIEAAWGADKLPIVVGGTGLYLRALMQGFSPIPDIPEDVRARVRATCAAEGKERFHAMLAARDPLMAARLLPSDGQRMMRAMEVIEATGRSLADWQAEPAQGGVPGARFLLLALVPPRDDLYARCDARFDLMLQQGALDEVRALDALGLDPMLPVMKALGVPELRKYLHGEWNLDEAAEKAKTLTRRFAKRQCTWIRNQFPDAVVYGEKYSESLVEKIIPIVREFLLTR